MRGGGVRGAGARRFGTRAGGEPPTDQGRAAELRRGARARARVNGWVGGRGGGGGREEEACADGAPPARGPAAARLGGALAPLTARRASGPSRALCSANRTYCANGAMRNPKHLTPIPSSMARF